MSTCQRLASDLPPWLIPMQIRCQDILTFCTMRPFWASQWQTLWHKQCRRYPRRPQPTIGPKTCSSAAVCGESAGSKQQQQHQIRLFGHMQFSCHSNAKGVAIAAIKAQFPYKSGRPSPLFRGVGKGSQPMEARACFHRSHQVSSSSRPPNNEQQVALAIQICRLEAMR